VRERKTGSSRERKAAVKKTKKIHLFSTNASFNDILGNTFSPLKCETLEVSDKIGSCYNTVTTVEKR